MFRRPSSNISPPTIPAERVTSVLGQGINWEGALRGSGGVRIEGTFEGEIAIRGLVVIGETGKVTCEHLRASTVIVAGAVKGNITAEKLEIRSTGRVWGDVVTVAFVTEEGAFLRGQMRMEEGVELGLEQALLSPNQPTKIEISEFTIEGKQPEMGPGEAGMLTP